MKSMFFQSRLRLTDDSHRFASQTGQFQSTFASFPRALALSAFNLANRGRNFETPTLTLTWPQLNALADTPKNRLKIYDCGKGLVQKAVKCGASEGPLGS